jgi:hypothetical protein
MLETRHYYIVSSDFCNQVEPWLKNYNGDYKIQEWNRDKRIIIYTDELSIMFRIAWKDQVDFSYDEELPVDELNPGYFEFELPTFKFQEVAEWFDFKRPERRSYYILNRIYYTKDRDRVEERLSIRICIPLIAREFEKEFKIEGQEYLCSVR